ncbi:MAG: DUF2147 domain-containing protein [Acidobacteriaceae bacterium]|jgi:uncharacterized protein (DUF2147 family)|nr:DUF2147 domain-containing protein [Acidobacteriaceae bacterium]
MKLIVIPAILMLLIAPLHVEESGIFGQWTDPSGSVIAIYRCKTEVCARLIVIGNHAPARVDLHNPNPSLRTHALCGMQIGSGFHLIDPGKADGGELYDPKSGKTYKGSMVRNGDTLKLRGYVGIKLLGRTEIWTRARTIQPVCSN